MKHAVFLFDKTGIMAAPWVEAGYECWVVDLQHPVAYETGGITTEGRLHKVHADLSRTWLPPIARSDIAFAFAFAFPPCDHLSVSGARWFVGKGLRRLSSSINLFATAAEFCEWTQAPYGIENPVSTISTYWRKPDHSFDPCDYGDPYTKKTLLWTGGGFVMPPKNRVEPTEGSKMHLLPPSADRHNLRSATPPGFARAVFESNHCVETRDAA